MPPSVHPVVGFLRSLLTRSPAVACGDRDLLERFRSGRDGEAFTALVQRHGPRVLGLARRVVGHHQTAEDVFQATFLLLARQAHAVRNLDAVGAWLSRTTFRLALRARRSQVRREQREALTASHDAPSPLEELTAREVLAILDEELARLPEVSRWPLVLCCLEGLSQEEAARHLECSPRAVRARLERGRARLRQRLEARGLSLPAALGAALVVAQTSSGISSTLRESTVQAVVHGGASPSVNALIRGTTMMLPGHLKAVTVAVLLIGALGVAAWLRPGVPAPEDAPPAPAPTAKVDLHGDPLPEDAVLRLGTLKQRAVNAKLAFSADGKSVVGVRGGRYVSTWDSATGQLREAKDLAGETWGQAYLSPDGRWLATDDAARNGALVIWDLDSGKPKHKFNIKEARYLMPVAFSPDGKHVAVVGNGKGKHVRAWRLEDGKEVFAKDFATDVASGLLSFTPDGTRLLACFGSIIDQGTYCWDLVSGDKVWQNKEFSPPNWVLTSDDKLIAPGDQVRVLDLNTGQPLKDVNLPPLTWDNHLSLTPDGKTLLVAGAEGVVVWDLAAGKERYLLKGAGEEMVVAPDGKTLLTNNGALQRWNLTTGKPLWADTWELGHAGEVTALAFSGDGQRLASASADGSVRLWDATTGKPLHVWSGHEARRPIRVWRYTKAGVTALALSRDGRWLLSAGSEGRLRLLDTTTGKEVQSLPLPDPDPGEADLKVYHVAVSADGTQGMASFGAQGGFAAVGQPAPVHTDKLLVWDLQTGKRIVLHRIPKSGSPQVIAPDTRTVAVNGGLIDVATGLTLRKLEGEEGLEIGREPMAFSGDSRLVIGGCGQLKVKDGERILYADGVRVWETATGKTVAHLKTPSWVAQVGFMPDNRFAVTHDLDGIQVWDLRTGESVLKRAMPQKVRSTATAGSYAGSFAFNPDGKRLATGHPDGTILVWDVNLPGAKPEPLAAGDVDKLWGDLKADDAAKAWQAAWRLGDDPDEALTLLSRHLKSVKAADAAVTDPLLKDLDSDDFAKRQAALRRLEELGPPAQPALAKSLETNPSAEQRKRIEVLLETLTSPARKPSADELRNVRAVAVLRAIPSEKSRHLLEALAGGVATAPLTREAKAALQQRP